MQALLIALVFSAVSMAAAPVVAQEDCSYPDDWDDFQWFRGCLEQHGLTDDWKPWMLHGAASLTGNPAIIRLLLDAGADANAVDDGGRTPLHEGAKNDNPVVAVHLLAAGADPNALDNDGYTPLHHSAARVENGRVIARLQPGDGVGSSGVSRLGHGVVLGRVFPNGAGRIVPAQRVRVVRRAGQHVGMDAGLLEPALFGCTRRWDRLGVW